jgi:hypothetical protein
MNAETGGSNAGYEKRDVSLVWVIAIATGIVLAIVVIVALLNTYFLVSKEEMVYEQTLRPESVALRELRAREDEVLNSYSVIDADSGVYRIPIRRAMQLAADEAYRERQEQ